MNSQESRDSCFMAVHRLSEIRMPQLWALKKMAPLSHFLPHIEVYEECGIKMCEAGQGQGGAGMGRSRDGAEQRWMCRTRQVSMSRPALLCMCQCQSWRGGGAGWPKELSLRKGLSVRMPTLPLTFNIRISFQEIYILTICNVRMM